MFDNLQYKYNESAPNKKVQNRLYHVADDPNSSALRSDDIDNQLPAFTQGAAINTVNNYQYDAEGRLISDKQEGIDLITWRIDGKMQTHQTK